MDSPPIPFPPSMSKTQAKQFTIISFIPKSNVHFTSYKFKLLTLQILASDELNLKGRPIWVRLKPDLTPKSHHLKQNRLDYKPLFMKGSNTDKPDLSDQQKLSLKDVRAHCYCASLVRTLFIGHTRATSFSRACIDSKTQQNIERMTFALTWCANIFVGCSVTLTFFSADHFLF